MKTKKMLKKVGLGLGLGALTVTDLSATTTTTVTDAQKAFCAAVGFQNALDSATTTSTVTATSCGADSTLASWTKFVTGGALVGTLYFGYKGSGIGDGDKFDLKKVVIAGALAALALQYGPIMGSISKFFA